MNFLLFKIHHNNFSVSFASWLWRILKLSCTIWLDIYWWQNWHESSMWKVTKRKCLLWISNILKYIKKSTSPHRYFVHVFFCHTTSRSKSVGLLSRFRNEHVTLGSWWFLGIFSQIKRLLRENFEKKYFSFCQKNLHGGMKIFKVAPIW